MTCCTYPYPHSHYPDWLRETVITEICRPSDGSVCGKHIRQWTVGDLLRVWGARPQRIAA